MPAAAENVASVPRKAEVLAPGYAQLEYPAPTPGTYSLPPLGEAADAPLLDVDGAPTSLHQAFGGRVVVLSFIYTSCHDGSGCPLASFVLAGVERRIGALAALRDRVRLVTVSFDPEHDRPPVMRRYGARVAAGEADWRFYTTASERELAPMLASYDQSVRKDYDEDGEYLGTMSHILRVYLIDPRGRIRNIYSPSFLHEETLVADIETLLLEPGAATVRAATNEAAASRPRLHGTGDERADYDTADYRTRSKALRARRGRPAELVANIADPPLGLPAPPTARDAAASPEMVALGRKLFYDRRLSHNDTISCAMCHIPEQGFTSNEIATAVGIEGRSVRRNAPTLYNVAYAQRLFHDGREDALEQQVWSPLLASNEMGNPSVGYVLGKLRSLADYDGAFESAFGGRGSSPGPSRGISMETLGLALAAYERTLVSASSPFDRRRYGGEDGALSAAAERGFALFEGAAGCAACHSIGERDALFTDHALHNTGIGFRNTHARGGAGARRLQVAPGRFVMVDAGVAAEAFAPPPADLGLYEITRDPADRWKYKTPTLRNVALTAPYMHDGSLSTLRSVVEFYNGGGVENPTLDERLRPLGLGPGEVDDLIAFLQSLTGDNVDELLADAFAAPIGDR